MISSIIKVETKCIAYYFERKLKEDSASFRHMIQPTTNTLSQRNLIRMLTHTYDSKFTGKRCRYRGLKRRNYSSFIAEPLPNIKYITHHIEAETKGGGEITVLGAASWDDETTILHHTSSARADKENE
uniref:Putative ovule protein n=1 Tax=Solanum chacoense TaxID=4108 RepID=A0A0V0IQ31_SOLCH